MQVAELHRRAARLAVDEQATLAVVADLDRFGERQRLVAVTPQNREHLGDTLATFSRWQTT